MGGGEERERQTGRSIRSRERVDEVGVREVVKETEVERDETRSTHPRGTVTTLGPYL